MIISVLIFKSKFDPIENVNNLVENKIKQKTLPFKSLILFFINKFQMMLNFLQKFDGTLMRNDVIAILNGHFELIVFYNNNNHYSNKLVFEC